MKVYIEFDGDVRPIAVGSEKGGKKRQKSTDEYIFYLDFEVDKGDNYE